MSVCVHVCECVFGEWGLSSCVCVFFFLNPSVSDDQHPVLRGTEFN